MMKFSPRVRSKKLWSKSPKSHGEDARSKSSKDSSTVISLLPRKKIGKDKKITVEEAVLALAQQSKAQADLQQKPQPDTQEEREPQPQSRSDIQAHSRLPHESREEAVVNSDPPGSTADEKKKDEDFTKSKPQDPYEKARTSQSTASSEKPYVPLRQRLEERKVEQGVQPKKMSLSQQAEGASFASHPKSGSKSLVMVDLPEQENILPELDRFCLPIENEYETCIKGWDLSVESNGCHVIRSGRQSIDKKQGMDSTDGPESEKSLWPQPWMSGRIMCESMEKFDHLCSYFPTETRSVNSDPGTRVANQQELDQVRKEAAADALKAKEKVEAQLMSQLQELKCMEFNLKVEGEINSELKEKIATLESAVEREAREAQQTKVQAVTEIKASTEKMEAMEVKWKAETEKNLCLNSKIEQMKNDLSKARAAQQQLEQAKAVGEIEAQRAKEEAETTIKALSAELKALEEKLKFECQQNASLKSQVFQLKKEVTKATSDISRAKVTNWKVESERNHFANSEIEGLKNDLSEARAAQLEFDQAKAVGDVQAQRAKEEAEKNIKALEDKLKAEFQQNNTLQTQMSQLKEEFTMARNDTQKTIDSQQKEISRLEKVISSLKADVENKTADSMLGNEAALQKKVELLLGEIASLKGARPRSIKENDTKDIDFGENSTIAGDSFTAASSYTEMSRGRKVGWFRRWVSGATVGKDGDSRVSQTKKIKKGMLRPKRPSGTELSDVSSVARDDNKNSVISENTFEDNGGSVDEDDATYESIEYSARTYSESFASTYESKLDESESYAGTYESKLGALQEATSTGSATENTLSSMKDPDSLGGTIEQINSSDSETDCTSSSETVEETVASSNADTGGIANWFSAFATGGQEVVYNQDKKSSALLVQ